MSDDATVRCRCGAAAIETAAPVRLSLWCACNDCRQKVAWSLANDPFASASRSRNVPPVQRAVYFENAIARAKGDMQPTLLREDGRSTFLVANCCRAVMAVSHAAYAGKVFMVLEASALIEGTVPEALARIYLKDYDPEDRGALPPVRCPSFRSDEDDVDQARKLYRPLLRQEINVSARFTETSKLFTFERLMSRLPPTVILGLREGAAVNPL